MKWWIVGYIVAQALDMTTTAINLRHGCREVVWANAPLAYGSKSAGIGLVLTFKGSHPTAVKVISGIGIASGTVGTIHNVQTTCR